MEKLKQNSNQAISLSGEYIRNNLRIMHPGFYCLERNLYKYDLKFLLRKDFQMIKELNEFIGMASRSGLVTKWLNHGNMPSYREGRGVTRTSLADTLLTYFLVVIFAKFILYSEMIIHKYVNQPNASKFWIFADLLISPDRRLFLNDLRY